MLNCSSIIRPDDENCPSGPFFCIEKLQIASTCIHLDVSAARSDAETSEQSKRKINSTGCHDKYLFCG